MVSNDTKRVSKEYLVPEHHPLSRKHLSFSFLVASIIQMHCNAEHTNSSYMHERPKLYLIRPEYRDYTHI
jgi:hypothetical protein